MSESSIQRQLDIMEKRVNQIEKLPETTLGIIGRKHKERDWEDFLVYFLDPTESHGFGTDILDQFLESVSKHADADFEEYATNTDSVVVDSQAQAENGAVDLLVYLPDEWFICIEMKVASPESGEQTVHYANADKIEDLNVADYTPNNHYLYLSPESAPSSTAKEFKEISWFNVVQHLENVLLQGNGKYPAKSKAQFADFLDTIRRQTNMGDFDGVSEETKLYTEYAETVERIIEKKEKDKEALLEAIEESFFTHSDANRENWDVARRSDHYRKIYKQGWQNLENNVDLEYEPHLKLDTSNPKIILRLDIEHGNKEIVRDKLKDKIGDEDWAEIESKEWSESDNPRVFLRKDVLLNLDNPDASISEAIQELHDLRDIIEPRIDEVVATY